MKRQIGSIEYKVIAWKEAERNMLKNCFQHSNKLENNLNSLTIHEL